MSITGLDKPESISTSFAFFLSFFKKKKLQLIHKVMLVSGVQQSDSVIYIILFFSIIVNYKILNITQ